jgi:hypothetical protein
MCGIPKAALKSLHVQNVVDIELTQFQNVTIIYISLRVKKWKGANLIQNISVISILKTNV